MAKDSGVNRLAQDLSRTEWSKREKTIFKAMVPHCRALRFVETLDELTDALESYLNQELQARGWSGLFSPNQALQKRQQWATYWHKREFPGDTFTQQQREIGRRKGEITIRDRARARAVRVHRLRRLGYTFKAIAELVECSLRTAKADAAKSWEALTGAVAKRFRNLSTYRCKTVSSVGSRTNTSSTEKDGTRHYFAPFSGETPVPMKKGRSPHDVQQPEVSPAYPGMA